MTSLSSHVCFGFFFSHVFHLWIPLRFWLLWFSKGNCKTLGIFTGREHAALLIVSLPDHFFLAPQSTSYMCKNIFNIFLCFCVQSSVPSLFQKKTPKRYQFGFLPASGLPVCAFDLFLCGVWYMSLWLPMAHLILCKMMTRYC